MALWVLGLGGTAHNGSACLVNDDTSAPPGTPGRFNSGLVDRRSDRRALPRRVRVGPARARPTQHSVRSAPTRWQAEIVERSGESGITLVTPRPYIGRWEWSILADMPALPLFMALVKAAGVEPTGADFVQDLRREFGARLRYFFPRRDAHVLPLLRRSGLIRLEPGT